MEEGWTMGEGWTRIDFVTEKVKGVLPLHDLARLGLVKMQQEPGTAAKNEMRWWWVEDASLDALLALCEAEQRFYTVYTLPADLKERCNDLHKGRRLNADYFPETIKRSRGKVNA